MPMSELNDKPDRKSILKSTIPQRKHSSIAEQPMETESPPSNKFQDLIKYYESLDTVKQTTNVKPHKDKSTVSFSLFTSPNGPGYETSSTGTGSTGSPDLIYPGLPKSTSSVISGSDTDSHNYSPDLGYTSITKPGSLEDNGTSSSSSRNLSPEYPYRVTPEATSLKSSESPTFWYKDVSKESNMRYLLDLKTPQSTDNETNSSPKSDPEDPTNDHNNMEVMSIPKPNHLPDTTLQRVANKRPPSPPVQRKCLNESQTVEDRDTSVRSSLSHIFEYSPPKYNSDFSQYKLVYDVSVEDGAMTDNSRKCKLTRGDSMSSCSDGYQYDEDFHCKSFRDACMYEDTLEVTDIIVLSDSESDGPMSDGPSPAQLCNGAEDNRSDCSMYKAAEKPSKENSFYKQTPDLISFEEVQMPCQSPVDLERTFCNLEDIENDCRPERSDYPHNYSFEITPSGHSDGRNCDTGSKPIPNMATHPSSRSENMFLVNTSTARSNQQYKSVNPVHFANIEEDNRPESLSSIISYGFESEALPEMEDERCESRLSELSYGFGHGKIASPRRNRLTPVRSRPSLSRESKQSSSTETPDLVRNESMDDSRNSFDPKFFSRTRSPRTAEVRYPKSGFRYSLPKPSDFLNGSQDLSESRNKAMRSFMSSCINQEPSFDTLPESGPSCLPKVSSSELPHASEHEHKEDVEKPLHKMKIDLNTVSYIMNNKRTSVRKDSMNYSREMTDDETDEHNYSVASLIGAFDELGIEVEFNDQEEQNRRRTVCKNFLMQSVREEDEHETEEKDRSMKLDDTKDQPDDVMEYQEDDKREEDPQILKENKKDIICEQSFNSRLPSDFSEKDLSKEKTEDISQENKNEKVNEEAACTPYKAERPGSPVIASSSKLKHLKKRALETCKVNLEKEMAPVQVLEQKSCLESTRQVFTDSSVKISKLDNSISTISMASESLAESSPFGDKTSEDGSPLVEPETVLKRPIRNSEYDKIERYANETPKVKGGRIEKPKRSSLTTKYKMAMEEEMNEAKKANASMNTTDELPSIVKNFLGVALDGQKELYETTVWEDESIVDLSDNNLFTFDEGSSRSSPAPRQNWRSSLADLTSSARALLKSATFQFKKKKAMDASQMLHKEMHVLCDSIKKQQLMIEQASKALKMCYMFKEFENSEEHVESERILLLAHLRRQAAMDAIKKCSEKPSTPMADKHGELVMNKIVIPLKNRWEGRSERRLHSKHEYVEWFMVVVRCGITVLGSQPIMCDRTSTRIVIPDEFVLSKMNPNAKIRLEIYRLKLKKKGDISHELKYHIRGNYSLADAWYKAISKLTHRSTPSKSSRVNLMRIFESSFMFVGHVEFHTEDLANTKQWKLEDAHLVLEGTVNMSTFYKESVLDLDETISGFLTHGTELNGYPIWNRRWCALEGHLLKFWDYPEATEPIMALDLLQCRASEVGIASREMCAKPKTILLELQYSKKSRLYENGNDSIVKEERNFLTLDSTKELNEWITKINKVLKALKNWNTPQV